LTQNPEFFPIAVNRVHGCDVGVESQHFGGVAIYQRIQLQMRSMVLEHGEYRSGQKHVAVVSQLHDQSAFQEG
jgi:hypothetical protein